MNILVALLITILFILIILVGYLIYSVRKLGSAGKNEDILYLQNQLNTFSTNIDQRIGESNKILHEHLLKASDTIRAVTEKLVRLDETNNKVVDFARQLQKLEYVLKNPKQRGIYGEYILENILSDTLPSANYKTQYRFKDGSIVDAAIFIDNKIIPVDAKFSLSKYYLFLDGEDKEIREKLAREIVADVKLRINETAKYVKPEENTTNFALMFIPGEGLFQQVISGFDIIKTTDNNDIISYAYSKSVVIVSPSNLFAYLQIILQALHEFKVKNSIADILNQVRNLIKHVKLYDEFLRRLGKNLHTVVNSYNSLYQQLKHISSDIKKLVPGENLDIVPELLDKSDIEGRE